MFKQDFIEREIEMAANAIASTMFGKERASTIIEYTQEDLSLLEQEGELLKILVDKYLSEGKINQAEDIIFDAIQSERSEINLKIALSFYDKINKYSDSKLEKCNFSRQEIVEGIEDIKKLYQQ